MAKMVAVLSVRAGGDEREVLGQVYEANSAFERLLQEWRRLDIYDEADELLARLVENYTAVIEGVALRAYGLAEESLGRSEGQISLLQAENQSLRSLLQLQASRFEVQMMEAENRLYEEFEKAQWGTFILNELSRRAFHLDHFVRSSEVYANAKTEYLSNGLHKCYTRSRGGGRPERKPSEAKGSVVEDLRLKPQLASIPQLRNLSQFS